ncbi:hypothetical protein EJ02DRAFT_82764 [Clathrospora elynae]|uniref:Membrane-associated proteins in eicosanoid and glutathione metabolism n=1 Tax=Clathrospora elynae TaxID=706981 RepID=A0A6A5SDI4_9PLEO|nr:hypothetical protein EJ02DRAFT_82764 [Clathrospora elynae]
MPFNYSFYSIPLCWLIALYPHAYSASLLKKANNNQRDNTNPRSTANLEHFQKVVTADIFAKSERAEACHLNGMENAPFFIGAVVVGNFVGLGASTMNIISGTYLGLRVLYSILYINTTTQKASFARSGVWFAGVVLLVTTYVKAGNKMNS